MRNSREQNDRKRMEVQLAWDVGEKIGPLDGLLYTVERVACDRGRQCWDIGSLTAGRNSGDAGSEDYEKP